MFALNFLLNFKTSVGQAVSGINEVNDSMNYLKQTQESLNKSMNKIFGQDIKNLNTYYNEMLSDMSKNYEQLGYSGEQLRRAMDMALAETGDLTESIIKNLKEASPAFNDSIEATGALRQELLRLAAMGDMASIRELEKNVSKLGNTMSTMNDKDVMRLQESLNNLNEDIVEGNTNVYKLNNNYSKLSKTMDKTAQSGENLIGSLWDRAKQAIGLTSAVVILTDALRNQDMMASTVAHSGLGDLQFAYSEAGRSIEKTGAYLDGIDAKMASARNTTNILSDVVGKMASSTSSSLTDATETMNQMFSMRVVNRDNINDLEDIGETALNMQHAFGMSAGQAAELGKSIMVIGGAGKEGFGVAGDALADVTARMGLFPEDIQVVASQVGVMTRQFKAFGNTDADIGKVVEGVGELVATFRNVGLEASDAMGILNDLMDPTKLDQNAIMWQGLGLSASQGMEMMMRGGEGLNDINERMVGLAQRLKQQYGGNIIALDSMAKVYGLTTQQVYSLSDATRALSEEQQAERDLAENAALARASMAKELTQIWNQISVAVHELLVPLMTQLTPLAEKFVKWLTTIAEKLNEGSISFDPWIRKISKIGKLLRAGIILKLLGILKPLGLIKGLIGGIGGALGGLGGKLGAIGGAGGGGGFMKAIMPDPKTAAAMAALIASIGISIGAAAAGISLLAEAMKGLSPEEFKQLGIVLGGIAIVIPGFAIGLIFLGKAAESAAVGLAIISLVLVTMGAMFLMIGAGINLAAKGIAILVGALSGADIEGKGKDFLLIAAGLAAIISAAVIGGPAAAIGIAAIGGAALLAAIGVRKMGDGLMDMGTGLDLIQLHAVAAGDALRYFFDQFGRQEQLFTKDAMKQLKDISKHIERIGLASAMLGPIAQMGGISGLLNINTDRGATPQSDQRDIVNGFDKVVDAINALGREGVLDDIKDGIDKSNELLGKFSFRSGRAQVEFGTA